MYSSLWRWCYNGSLAAVGGRSRRGRRSRRTGEDSRGCRQQKTKYAAVLAMVENTDHQYCAIHNRQHHDFQVEVKRLSVLVSNSLRNRKTTFRRRSCALLATKPASRGSCVPEHFRQLGCNRGGFGLGCSELRRSEQLVVVSYLVALAL